MTTSRRVAVIGAGLTGLAAAVRLGELGADVVIFEAAPRPGGVVRSERRDGYLLEFGPTSMSAPGAQALALLERLGLAAAHVESSPAAKERFVVRDGALVPIPLSPSVLLTSPLLSPAAKLRLAGEPFAPAAPADLDESVAEFVRRRLGDEVLDYLADPFISGVFAGDPARLSLAQAFPKVHRLEQEHGSLIKGMMQRAKTGGGAMGGPLWSFPEGLGAIPRACADRLGGALRCGVAAHAIRPVNGRWRIELDAGGVPATEEADVVLWAAPAHAWPEVAAHSPELAPALSELGSVEHAPIAVVTLGYRRDAVAHALDGFGALIPAVERRALLGVIFSSTLFPDRAPAGHVLLTAFAGGTRHPALLQLDDPALVALATQELGALVGATGEPAFAAVQRWPCAIPQYAVGYGHVRAALADAERVHHGVVLAGTYRDGVAVGDALASGIGAAERAMRS